MTTQVFCKVNFKTFGIYSAVFACVLVSACATVVRNPVPEAEHLNVTVHGNEHIRQWGDGLSTRVFPTVENSADFEAQFGGIMHQEHNYLVISGGGARGAYGAGVLTAWSKLGTRPNFAMVTGVSTGALIAPFAFLGSEYDARLERVYTTLETRKLINSRSFFAIISGDSIVDSSPLSKLLEEVIDDDMIEAIASEYRKGRQLVVGTTNLDAGRPVVWNITRIAASGHPDAKKLIRQVLLASASIPGAFPPVYIEVETADGRKYDEMHVDGGASSQMFFYPDSVNWKEIIELLDVQRTPTVYLIRNAFINPEYKVIQPRLLRIANRTIDSLIRTQGIGDFYRIWTLAERDKLDLQVTWIPDGTNDMLGVQPSEEFDPRYMKALFEFGHMRTLAGETWSDFSDIVNDN